MATIGNGNPKLYVEISGSQLSGSGNSRSVRVSMKCRVNGNTSPSYASWYGYPANYRAYVQDKNGNWIYGSWKTLKGTESWKSSDSLRSFSQDLTVDVGTTSSKTINIGFEVDSFSGSSDWDGSSTTTMSVGATNVPPVISGTVATSPSGTIAENTSSIKITAPAASDANGNLSGYRAQVSINGGGYADIYRGSSREYSHNVSGYGEGTTFKYRFDAYDAAGAYSVDWVYSGTVTKNTFTGDTLASSSSVSFSSSSIGFTYSGAKNTNGNTSFTRTLTCDGLTVYNGSLGASPATITIYKSGTVPTGCYVKFDDIKKKTINGTLSFTLRTTNAYGTSKSSSKTITVDLRTQPNPAKNQSISTNSSHSTIYKKVAFANNYYFLPDGTGIVRVQWDAGSDKLGGTVSYEIYVAYGSGSYQKVADVPSNGGTYHSYNHVIPKQTTSQQFKYMIRTKTSYGYYSDAVTPAATLHYYNSPSINIGNIVRGEKSATITVLIYSSSSIPGISVVGTYVNTTLGGTPVSLATEQGPQELAFSGLTGNDTYTARVVYNDNTGFASNQTKDIGISPNLPIMFLNKYGLGIGGGEKADAYTALRVGGAIATTGLVDAGSILTNSLSCTEIDTKTNVTVGQDLKVKGDTYLEAGSKFVTSNNYGVLGRKVDGTADYMMYMGTDDRIKLSYNKRAIDVNGNMVFNTGGQTFLDNAKYHYGRRTDGNSRKLIGCSSSDNLVIGDDATKHPSVNIYGDNLKFNGTQIVAYGTNSNGDYVKFYDGTMICWRAYHYSSSNIAYTSGSLFFGNSDNWVFPVAFAWPPQLSFNINDAACLRWVNTTSVSTTGFNSYVICSTKHNGGFTYYYTAIGRWKK